MVWYHLMARALGDGRNNLERLAVWKKGILLGGLGDLMKMWIVFGRLSCESEEVALPRKCSVTDASNDCPVFFGRAYISNHTNYR
jgi:hypothetical protein